MVGKIHKKKLSEYTEAAEYEDKHSDAEGGDEDTGGKEYRGSGSESENGDGANNENNKNSDSQAAKDDDEETTLGEDDERTQGQNDYDEDDDVGEDQDEYDEDDDNAKKPKKRKAAEKAKKSNNDDESDDEALNGVTPKKKGRKPAGKNAVKGVASKAAKAKPKKAAPVDEDDEEEDDNDDGGEEEEEEYEVKDIVGHKTERGVSYFLIRWKGYTKADDTWEPEDTLSCPEIIEKYKKKQQASTPKKGSVPASKKGKAAAASPKGSKKQETEQEWEVDKIIDYAEEKKGRVFRIRWKGFGPKHDTWEPEENLNCNDIIDKFLKRMKSQENLTFKELREEPKKTKRLVNETAPRTNIHNPIGRKSKRGGNKKRVFYGEED